MYYLFIASIYLFKASALYDVHFKVTFIFKDLFFAILAFIMIGQIKQSGERDYCRELGLVLELGFELGHP